MNAHLILTTLSLIFLAFSCKRGSTRATRQSDMLIGAALAMLPLTFAPLTTISLILFEATQTTLYWAAFALLCVLFATVANKMLKHQVYFSGAERKSIMMVVLPVAGSLLIAPWFSEHESAPSPTDAFFQWYLLALWCLANINLCGVVLLYALTAELRAKRILLTACLARLQLTAIGASLP